MAVTPHHARTVRTEAEIIRDHKRAGRKETDAECVRECIAVVRMMMALGWDEDTQAMEFGVTVPKLVQYRRAIMAKELATVSHRSAEELFVEYRLQMMDSAQALLEIGNDATKDKQFAAATNAHRARAAIVDKVMDRGQELGVIPRAAKRTEIVGGIMLAQLSDTELLAEVHRMSKDVTELVKRYGGGGTKFTDAPPPTDIYRGAGTPLVIDVTPPTVDSTASDAVVRTKATR